MRQSLGIIAALATCATVLTSAPQAAAYPTNPPVLSSEAGLWEWASQVTDAGPTSPEEAERCAHPPVYPPDTIVPAIAPKPCSTRPISHAEYYLSQLLYLVGGVTSTKPR